MTVEFLIREHLQMSQVAFRRDSEDPHVVASFADLVGTEEHLKLLCLMTLVDIGAVSPDTLTPWKEDAALAALRRHVQPPDARLRRRARRKGSRGPLGPRGGPPGGHHRGRAAAGFSRGCRGGISPASASAPSTATFASRAESARRGPRVSREARRRLGNDDRHARQAVPLLEHLRRPLLFRHGHPSWPGDDDAGRPGARRVPVHRRGEFPGTERRPRAWTSAGCSKMPSPDASMSPRCCVAACGA